MRQFHLLPERLETTGALAVQHGAEFALEQNVASGLLRRQVILYRFAGMDQFVGMVEFQFLHRQFTFQWDIAGLHVPDINFQRHD